MYFIVLAVIVGVLLLAGSVALLVWSRHVKTEHYYSARHRNQSESAAARVVIGLDSANNTGGS